MKYINDIPFLFIFLSIALYIPFRLMHLKRKERACKISKEFTVILLIAYIETLLYLTLFPASAGFDKEVKANLIPFQTIHLYVNYHENLSLQIINLVGNVVVFMPIGIFAPLLLKNTTWLNILLIGFCSTMFIESMQLILSIFGIISRSFDVDDLLLNTIGVLFGYVIFLIIKKLFPKRYEN